LYEIQNNQLQKVDELQFNSEITAVCLNQDATTAIVALNNSPDYDIHIISIKSDDTRQKLETV